MLAGGAGTTRSFLSSALLVCLCMAIYLLGQGGDRRVELLQG